MMTTKVKWPCFFSFPKSILQAGIPLIFLLLSSVVNAADRPKVGLVLGGGGAAGVAHVGVLKVLEEQNIPIDYIAGTSMGAIVAGLYASGMSANELEQAVYSLDWLALFDDKQPLNQQGFHQKRLNSGFFSVGKLGVKEGTLLAPSGLVSGQKLLFELRRLFRPVAHINNFDQLKIPFRAVATDIETGQQVVLKQGNIAQAIRASMSIPGMFSPVRVGDKLLVDGFVANNVPVDVARDMGADILIVVNIPTFLEEKEKLGSAVDISLQAMQLMMLKTSAPQIKTLSRNDILIEPGTKDIGSLSFDRVRETIPLGIKAARAQLPALKRLSQTAGLTTNTQAKPTSPDLLSARISAIKLHNESILNDRILLQRLGIKTGETLNADRLQRGLDAIHGLGHFDLVDYSLADDGKGGTILSINTHKRSTGDRHVHFGASLADNLEGDTSYQFGIKYTRSDINDMGAEWSNSLIFGDSIQLESQFYQPIPSQNGFLDASISYQEQDFFFFEGEERTSEFRGKQSDVALDIGKELGNWGEARVGAFYSHLEPDEKTGSTNFPAGTAFTSAGLRAQFNINTTDDDLLPSFGERLNVTYTHGSEALGSDTDFDTLEIRGTKVWSKDKHRFLVSGELGTTFEDEASPSEQLALGGLGRLSGLARNQLRGNHLVLGSAVYMRELADIPAIKGAVYAGASLELGNVWQAADNIDASDLLITGSAFVGADTPVGLAYFGVAQTEGFDIQPFLYLGQGF